MSLYKHQSNGEAEVCINLSKEPRKNVIKLIKRTLSKFSRPPIGYDNNEINDSAVINRQPQASKYVDTK